MNIKKIQSDIINMFKGKKGSEKLQKRRNETKKVAVSLDNKLQKRRNETKKVAVSPEKGSPQTPRRGRRKCTLTITQSKAKKGGHSFNVETAKRRAGTVFLDENGEWIFIPDKKLLKRINDEILPSEKRLPEPDTKNKKGWPWNERKTTTVYLKLVDVLPDK